MEELIPRCFRAVIHATGEPTYNTKPSKRYLSKSVRGPRRSASSLRTFVPPHGIPDGKIAMRQADDPSLLSSGQYPSLHGFPAAKGQGFQVYLRFLSGRICRIRFSDRGFLLPPTVEKATTCSWQGERCLACWISFCRVNPTRRFSSLCGNTYS
jgi:hypothetical protein